jgi:hypothetical protein
MNIKRLAMACLAVFVFVFTYDYILHEKILRMDYVLTGYLWRSPEDMPRYFGSLFFGQLLLSVAFCLIYAFLVGAHSNIRRGMIYGLLAGVLLSAPNFIMFAVQPMPLELIIKWVCGRLVQMLLAGSVLGAIYRTAPVYEAPAQALSALETK